MTGCRALQCLRPSVLPGECRSRCHAYLYAARLSRANCSCELYSIWVPRVHHGVVISFLPSEEDETSNEWARLCVAQLLLLWSSSEGRKAWAPPWGSCTWIVCSATKDWMPAEEPEGEARILLQFPLHPSVGRDYFWDVLGSIYGMTKIERNRTVLQERNVAWEKFNPVGGRALRNSI